MIDIYFIVSYYLVAILVIDGQLVWDQLIVCYYSEADHTIPKTLHDLPRHGKDELKQGEKISHERTITATNWHQVGQSRWDSLMKVTYKLIIVMESLCNTEVTDLWQRSATWTGISVIPGLHTPFQWWLLYPANSMTHTNFWNKGLHIFFHKFTINFRVLVSQITSKSMLSFSM